MTRTKATATYFDQFKNLEPDAKSGYKYGLELLLDVEQFNYGYQAQPSPTGFRITLHHHQLASIKILIVVSQSIENDF